MPGPSTLAANYVTMHNYESGGQEFESLRARQQNQALLALVCLLEFRPRDSQERLRTGDEPEGLLSAVEPHHYRRLTLSAVLRRVFGDDCDRIIRISPADTHVATAQHTAQRTATSRRAGPRCKRSPKWIRE